MTHTVLEVSNLRKTFKGRGGPHAWGKRPRIVAVDDVSFTLTEGTALGLVGESGSGKSTIGRMLVGLAQPDSGHILVAGTPRARRARGNAERLRRARDIQLVFQDPFVTLDPRLTPAQTLHRVLKLHGWRSRMQRRERVSELLHHVGLSDREGDRPPQHLSGGQRQRVGIARALAVEPSVLVLDEPAAGLDVSVQAQLLRLLEDLRATQHMTYVFISHDLAVIRHITDEAIVLRNGKAVEHGTTRALLDSPQHPYTQLLLASIPRPGWDPAEAVRLRRNLADARTSTGGHHDRS